jgi:hypothetical protein
MVVMADNDVGGAVGVLRRILESDDNAAWLEILGVAVADREISASFEQDKSATEVGHPFPGR